MSRDRHPRVTPHRAPVIMRGFTNLAIDTALGLTDRIGRAWIHVPDRGVARCHRDVRYGPEPRQRLDVHVPRRARDVHVLFIHGGSFRACSKHSHLFAARALARRGLHVYSIDYGLAPRHRYPTAHRDALAAYDWLARGPGRGRPLVTAGDSAGANLALSIAVVQAGGFLEATPSRPVLPRAVLCGSGLFRVRGSAEAYRDDPIARARLAQIERDYLAGAAPSPLAEPLAAVEGASASAPWIGRLAPVFIAVGERDPIRRDSERLARALPRDRRRLVRYPGQGHAFMISPLSRAADRCWTDAVEFLESHTR